MSGIRINPKMLTLAREARGLSQVELASKINGSQANVARWEWGTLSINEESFLALQKTLKLPAEFFFQEGEIYPPSFYRKRDKIAVKLLNKVDANINIYQLNIDKLLKASNHNPAIIPALLLEKYETPEKVAQELRKKCKIGRGPLPNLLQIMEQEKILIVFVEFGTDRVDSRSVYADHKQPITFVNKSLLGDRLRFTLAYELGHLVMHTSGIGSFGEEAGHEANLFAAEFLMPEKDIILDFKDKHISLPLLAELKKKWKVSMQALLYRADSLGLLDYNQKRYLLAQFNQLKIRRREPVELDIPKEKPALLQNLIGNYRSRQKLSLKGMAKFFCLTEEEFIQRYS